jgi:DNA polymerase III subunit alpha
VSTEVKSDGSAVTQANAYVPLRIHSEFSLIDSTIRLPDLVKQAKHMGLPALAVTDHLNLFALVKFFKEAEASGIKPIVGSDCVLLNPDTGLSQFTLLCQNHDGYLNVCRLLSLAYTERDKSQDASLSFESLHQHAAGLIALVGYGSEIAHALAADQWEQAISIATRWKQTFGDRLYIELSRCGRRGENRLVPQLAELANALDIPCVATNLAVYLRQDEKADARIDDFTAHEARVCIHEGFTLDDARRPRKHTREQYLLSTDAMRERFSDVPQAVRNTLELGKRCNVQLKLGTYFLPKFPSPENLTTEEHLAVDARKGLADRLEKLQRLNDLATTVEEYQARLELELGVINRMGFPGYFLIVAEFIGWAKDNGIPVGPGRGSGAGSLVAYALKITDLDPIRYELLFERFLNPERVSMPDFDIDFCMDQRDKVIQHVSDAYGADRVSQIITYGTMAAKACIRDAGRVLGMSYGHTDSIAKLIPNTLGIELPDALKESSDLRNAIERDEKAQNLMELALKLEGLTRNVGKHAGGVVISPSALTDFTPLFSEGRDPEAVGELPVTQFDKDDVESIGLVKFDFLGLRTLTIIDWACKAINKARRAANQPELDLTEVRLDDERTFALLQSGRTTAVFQLESRGMKELAKKLKPNTFEDIIALGALFRPGPLQSGMVDEFVERKHGRRAVEYPHPSLETVLQPTYGVIVYQEQVMQIAQVLAGYTLGGADMLRRAMGKKKPEEMAKQRVIFSEGAAKNAVSAEVSSSIFDLMEKFAEYGFNKSHSAAYAMVTYHTAYLKAYYPAEFMAAVLSSEADNTEKIQDFLVDARAFQLRVLTPCVQNSQVQFAAQEAPMTIRYGLSAIKGVGVHVCEEIIKARANGKFRDLADFVARLSGAKPNKRVFEALIDSGALDKLSESTASHRAALHAELADALKLADKQARDEAAGQFDMFGAAPPKKKVMLNVPEFDLLEKLQREKNVLGGYLSGHPLDQHRSELNKMGCLNLQDQANKPGPKDNKRTTAVPALVVGEIEAVRRKEGVAFTKIADGSGGFMEIGFFKDVLARHNQMINDGGFMLIAGQLSWDGFNGAWQVKARQALRLEDAFTQAGSAVHVRISGAGASFIANLNTVLNAHRGQTPVIAHLSLPEGEVQLQLGRSHRVAVTPKLKADLQAIGGVVSVELEFEAQRLLEQQDDHSFQASVA